MPNITIYLDTKEYNKFTNLSDNEQDKLRKSFKERLEEANIR